jgi:hypothetical protein
MFGELKKLLLYWGKKLEIIFDSDVKAVLEFMYLNLPASKLIGVAKSVAEFAPIFWQHYPKDSFLPAHLKMENIKSMCDSPQVAIL